MTTSAMPVEARALKLVRDPSQYPEYVDRWAIIVGVSQYQNEQINLKYAHRDADELYKLIQTPSGGGFAQEHIVKLTDAEATTAKITRALRSFLKKPARDDIVLIYFACHGSPDPDRPDIVYLLTHDTDPLDISGTALPMREIDLCLKENLLADRVILIADTCHSAAIGGKIGRRSTVDNSAEVNRYLQELSGTRGGIALLTSAEASETSQEGEQWGGGHGVFTHYLLEGMRGAADREPKNGTVSVGELFDYVREQVQKATGNAQHPSVGPNSFDRRLPVAVTGGVSAQEQYRLGCHLFEIGRLLNDQEVLSAARTQLQQAIHLRELNREAFPAAELQMGRIWMSLGELQSAIVSLQKAATSADIYPEAKYYEGVALSKRGEYRQACQTLNSLLKRGLIEEKAWLSRAYIARLSAFEQSNVYILFIGVGFRETDYAVFAKHLQILNKFFEKIPGTTTLHKIELINGNATLSQVLKTFEQLKRDVRPEDTVILYFSGDGAPETSESVLILQDSTRISSHVFEKTITAQVLHELINEMPAVRKTVILETMPNLNLLNLARTSGLYAIFMTASPGQQAYNDFFADIQASAPLFAHCFFCRLDKLDNVTITCDEMIALVTVDMHKIRQDQTPLYVGDPNRLLFSGVDSDFALLDIVERRNYATMPVAVIRAKYQEFQQMAIAFSQAHYRFGRAFLEKHAFSEAIVALEQAIQQHSPPDAKIHFALALAHLGAENYGDAVQQLQYYLATTEPSAISSDIQALITEIDAWATQTSILLVGIDHYEQSELPRLAGAVNDALAMKNVLMQRYGFREREITVLLNEQATRAAITNAFAQVARRAHTNFGLFYFAGLGSEMRAGSPTIISYDGRQSGVYDIPLSELAAHTSTGSSQLLTIIDAGWAIPDNDQPGSRVVAMDERPQPIPRAVKLVKATRVDRNLSGLALQIGRVSIYNSSIQKQRANAAIEQALPAVSGEGNQVYGCLTHWLLQQLAAADRTSLTYAKLAAINPSTIVMNKITEAPSSPSADTLKTALKSLFVPNKVTQKPQATPAGLDEVSPVFIPIPSHQLLNSRVIIDTQPQLQFVDALLTLERVDLTNEMVEIVKRMIEQRNEIYPEGYLYLGIAYLVRNAYEKAIAALDMALKQRNNNFAIAHYYLGRTLFVSGQDLARAESELRIATQQAPENIAAFYFLGQTIRRRVEQETLVEAENALRKYREGGAPLGELEEVDAFLRERKQS